MNMTIAIILIMLGAGVGLWATTRTRTARLAQMARLNGCRFDKEKDTVTTELTAGRLEFLRYFFINTKTSAPGRTIWPLCA